MIAISTTQMIKFIFITSGKQRLYFPGGKYQKYILNHEYSKIYHVYSRIYHKYSRIDHKYSKIENSRMYHHNLEFIKN